MRPAHDLRFGVFLTPVADPPHAPVELAVHAERAGLDLVTFQDHPYQPAFADTWTLLSWVAAHTERIRLSGNVMNLPLRPPAVLARSVATLDRLSGGRVELALGAGGFWDAIAAMGGRRLEPGASIQALDDAVTIIRALWDTSARGGVRVPGGFWAVDGAKRGPAPAHDVEIWVGALKPRLLRLVGRVADGWLPSLPYLADGPASLAAMNRHIDDGAAEAGRDPGAIRRMLNVGGRFTATGSDVLVGPPEQWAEELADIALTYGTSTFVLIANDDPTAISTFAAEVAPAVRELVAAERR